MPCNKNGRAQKGWVVFFFFFHVIIKEVISKGYKGTFFFLISKAFLRVGIVTVY